MKSVFAGLALYFVAFVGIAVAGNGGVVRIGVVQLPTANDGNFSAMLEYAKRAKTQGAQIVIFPETSDMGWLNPDAFYHSEPIPGKTTEKFADIARAADVWVAAGLAERGSKVADNPVTYEAFDAAILISPDGALVLKERQHNVVKNAFSSCPTAFGSGGCQYTAGTLDDLKVVETPFGRVGMLICADAYTYDVSALDAVKAQKPDLVLIPWGVTAETAAQCGQEDYNATQYASKAAKYLGSTYVVGANGQGDRPYGRSWYWRLQRLCES
ncbi:hypothetical protein GCM10007880_63370 [Mesorhizobium amorphae]|uniref:carbon-nitrogen hydrolase family protein n=1 Tax=Mesorhizobium amorphae TaxID=71433 RepID=UPI00235D36D8|nr:carbon-nitrogen hydrolase family protein [Mesorhizobium amorphae]GLR45819.1 hypothetical protein GCM10007880_63370 [Mesorhizobium amorphae]